MDKLFINYSGNIESFKRLGLEETYKKCIVFIEKDGAIYTHNTYYAGPDIIKSIQEALGELQLEVKEGDYVSSIKQVDGKIEATMGTFEKRDSQLLEDSKSYTDDLKRDVTTAITAEYNRAIGVEQSLSDRINSHLDITERELSEKADKDSVYDKEQIDQKLTGVYKIQGSCTFESLPETNKVGDVYNITDSFTLDEKEYTAGTNIVYTENGWDVLAGIFDTSELELDIQRVSNLLAQEAVRAIKAENGLEDKFNNYLPLSGGTLNGQLNVKGRVVIDKNALQFTNSDGFLSSRLLMPYAGHDYDLSFSIGDNWYRVWHEGNDGPNSGLYADHAYSLDNTQLGINNSSILKNVWYTHLLGNQVGTLPHNNNANGILNINTYDEYQHHQLGFTALGLYYRHSIGATIDQAGWHKLAFTDSDITGNAATATKLATPVKLWGNDFDGSKDIDGHILLKNNKYIKAFNTAGNEINIATITSGNEVIFGHDAPLFEHNTSIHGKNIIFRSHDGNSFVNLIKITNNGNVGIGITDPKAKLTVDGSTYISKNVDDSQWVSDPNMGQIVLNAKGTNYNLGLAVTQSGKGVIQCGNYTIGSIPLVLNPNGDGKNSFVGIGTFNPQAKLDVNGNVNVKGLYSSESITVANGKGIYIKDSNGDNPNVLQLNSSNNLLLGYGSSARGYKTTIEGNTIDFKYGTNHSTGMVINSNGNIGIGTTDPQYKLEVNGSLHTNSLSIQSDTKVDNLNADKLDGYEAEDFALKSDLIIGQDITDGVYAVKADESLCTVDEADTSCIGVALIQGEHKLMIAKNDATDGTNTTLYWGRNLKRYDLAGITNMPGGGFLPRPDGSYYSTPNLSGDFTTWTSGVLSDFNGKDNTAAIIAGYTEHGVSMETRDMCSVLNTFNASDSHNDWYVPACGQLALTYLNKSEINTALAKIGGTALADAEYWSTSEGTSNTSWYVNFDNGNVYSVYNRENVYRVRFVRNIQIEPPKSVKDTLIEIISKVNNLESQIGDINTILESIING